MQIHVPTLFYLMCGVTLLAAGKMAVEWRREGCQALLWWSLGNLAVAIAIILSSLRPLGFLDISIGLSNAVLLLGYGFGWRGAAQFTGRRAPWPVVGAGALVWLVAWTYPPFSGDADLRVLLVSVGVAAYSLATGLCFLKSRERLVATTQAGIAFLLHGLVYIVRIASLPMVSARLDPLQLNSLPMALVLFEGVLFIVITAYLFLAMARERGEQILLVASQIDYLTGVPNRRTFTERARRQVAAPPGGGRRGVAVVFDLDHFKSINDQHGHAVGDEVLRLFCRVTEAELGADDLFGRLGGEEFAALLPGDTVETAARKTSAIIERFAAEARTVAGRSIEATVSAGLAGDDGAGDLDDLLAAADAALYRAKRIGRNRLAVADLGDVSAPGRPVPGQAGSVPAT